MTLPRMFSRLSLKRLAKVAIIRMAPAFRGETIRAWLPRQRFWTAPYREFSNVKFSRWKATNIFCRHGLDTAAVNFISTRLIEYYTNRWGIRAPSLGQAS